MTKKEDHAPGKPGNVTANTAFDTRVWTAEPQDPKQIGDLGVIALGITPVPCGCGGPNCDGNGFAVILTIAQPDGAAMQAAFGPAELAAFFSAYRMAEAAGFAMLDHKPMSETMQ